MSSLKVSQPRKAVAAAAAAKSKRSSSGSSGSSGSGKGKSRSQKNAKNLEGVLYVEMYTSKVGTLAELWQFHNSDEFEYIPSIHVVNVVDDKGHQYIFRENERGTEIFGGKLLGSGVPKLIKLNKKRMGVD
jgi:hypothetical protein